MRNLLILAVVLGIAGLVVGYLIFARRIIGNDLIPLNELFSIGDPDALGAVRDAAGFAEKRQNIYISGGVGAAVGVVLGFVLNRKR